MLKISFDFDEITQKVSNVVVSTGEGKPVVKKKKKNKSNDSRPIVEVEANKIVLSDAVVEMLDADAENGDRITINYHQESNTITYPLIGKSSAFADKQAGNKLTKSNTVSFKGKQRDVLVEYGELFTLELFSEGVYKLIPITDIDEVISADSSVKESLTIEESELKETNDIDIDNEIAELMNNDIDDLPF